MKTKIITWGWKEQPDLGAIAGAVREISGGKVFMEEYDTGGDMYAVIISDRGVSEEEAQKLFQVIRKGELNGICSTRRAVPARRGSGDRRGPAGDAGAEH